MNEEKPARPLGAATGYATEMLKLGMLEDHLGTVRRGRAMGDCLVWSGDLRRNAYLRENLAFIEANRLAEIAEVVSYEDQCSYVKISWVESHNRGVTNTDG